MVAVPAAEVLGVVREAARCGVRALLVVSAGFSDSDEPEGCEREEAVLDAVRAHGLRLVGPNALGVVNTEPGVSLHALIGRVGVAPGGLALSSQSGALGLALLGHAAARGLGISSFVALGNRADVSTNDLLEHWADDERTAVVALYMESFGNPRRFSQVSRRVSRRKPILAVKGGRGRLLDDAATDALFRQAGVLRVETTQTLFDAAELLERQPLPGGRRVGVVTNSGGLGVVAADACAARGLELAAPGEQTRARLAAALPGADRLGNPIDLGVRAPVADDLEAIAALLDDEHVDAVLVLHVELGSGDPAERLQALEAATRDAAKPVLACVVGAGGELPRRARWRVPNYRFPEAAVRALGLAADRRDWLSRPLGQAPVVEGLDLEAARAVAAAAGEGALEDGRARALLSAVGIEPGAGVDVRMVADPDLGPLIGVGRAVAPRAAHRRRCRRARPWRPGAARRRRAPGRPRGWRPGPRRRRARPAGRHPGPGGATPAREDVVSKNALMSRYDQLCAEHEWKVPERYNIAADVCDKHARDKQAMVWERFDGARRDVSWGELQDLSNQAANVLREHGVERGERVAVVLPPTPETAAVFFGTWKNAGILLSMSVLYGDDGIAHRLRDSQPRVLVTDKANVGALRPVAGRRDPRSSTTGCSTAPRPTSRRPTPPPTTRRSSTTRAAPPAWPRASSTRIATCSRTRSSSTATRSRTASASTAWGSGRGRPASRRCSGRGAWAPSRSSCSARAASTLPSSWTSSAATRSRTSSRPRRRCGR